MVFFKVDFERVCDDTTILKPFGLLMKKMVFWLWREHGLKDICLKSAWSSVLVYGAHTKEFEFETKRGFT